MKRNVNSNMTIAENSSWYILHIHCWPLWKAFVKRSTGPANNYSIPLIKLEKKTMYRKVEVILFLLFIGPLRTNI